MTDNKKIIEIKDLVKTYMMGEVEVQALKSVSLDILSGEFVAVMGPSGSGKSTLMNILGCLDKPSSGNYILDGFDVSELEADDLAEIRNLKLGFVFQGFNLLHRTTALENVELPMLYSNRYTREERDERATAALESVGLKHRYHHIPSQMSGGEQQRVAIARSLVNDPLLILADEPTGNLDTKTSIEIMKIFQDLNNDKKITVIMVTHEPDISRFASRIVMLRDGVIRHDEPVYDRLVASEILRNKDFSFNGDYAEFIGGR